MISYIARRLLLIIPTFFGVSFVVWVVLSSAPEPPIEAQASTEREGERRDEGGGMSTALKVFRAQYALDRPAILNFFYDIDDAEVRRALADAEALGGEIPVARRVAARERLIKWGYYAVPNLYRITEEAAPPLRRTALAWFIQNASRVTLVPPGGIVDDATAARNEEVTRENAWLRLLAWTPDASPERVAAGLAGFATWWSGARSRYPEGVSHAEVRDALDTEDRTQFEAWGTRAVPALVALCLEGGARAHAAVVQLSQSARIPTGNGKDETARLHNEVVAGFPWHEGASAPVQDGARAIVRAWWEGSAGRWDYSGARWLRVLFLETQFTNYWSKLLRGDLGNSTKHRTPVISLVLARLKYSLSLQVPALLISFLVSIPLGLWSATFHGSFTEKGVALLVFALYSLPSFFVATLCIRFLAEGQPESLGLIPTGGYEDETAWELSTFGRLKNILWHLAAPLFCLTYASFATLSRYAKSGTLNVIRSDYVRTARAKGVSEFWVLTKHAARNGIIPVITILGTTLPVVVGGSFVIETVFQIPGFGLLLVESVRGNDYPVVVGVTLITAILTMIGILLSDLLYAVADPRISYQ